jgi:hypothetical protein
MLRAHRNGAGGSNAKGLPRVWAYNPKYVVLLDTGRTPMLTYEPILTDAAFLLKREGRDG